jgi:hypothetical protein
MEDLMLGSYKIEEALVKKYKIYTPIVFIIVLLLIIINSRNHYKIFREEINSLRSSIETRDLENKILLSFNTKIYEQAKFIGREWIFPCYLAAKEQYEISAELKRNGNQSANSNLKKVLIMLSEAKMVIHLNFNDNEANRPKEVSLKNDGGRINIRNPAIYIRGKSKRIVAMFIFNGEENLDELKMINKYIIMAIQEGANG